MITTRMKGATPGLLTYLNDQTAFSTPRILLMETEKLVMIGFRPNCGMRVATSQSEMRRYGVHALRSDICDVATTSPSFSASFACCDSKRQTSFGMRKPDFAAPSSTKTVMAAAASDVISLPMYMASGKENSVKLNAASRQNGRTGRASENL